MSTCRLLDSKLPNYNGDWHTFYYIVLHFFFIGCLCNKEGIVNQCDAQTGQCNCKSGFTGERCYSCIPGKYGINCDNGKSKSIPKQSKTLYYFRLRFL